MNESRDIPCRCAGTARNTLDGSHALGATGCIMPVVHTPLSRGEQTLLDALFLADDIVDFPAGANPPAREADLESLAKRGFVLLTRHLRDSGFSVVISPTGREYSRQLRARVR